MRSGQRLKLVAVLLVASCSDSLAPTGPGTIAIRIISASAGLAYATNSGDAQLVAADGPRARLAIFTGVRVRVIGPTSRTVDLTLASGFWEGQISELEPGSYSVCVEGASGTEVDQTGEARGIEVRAGQTSSASVQLRDFVPQVRHVVPGTGTAYTITLSSLPCATTYRVEVDDDPAFVGAAAQESSDTVLNFLAMSSGATYVRAQARVLGAGGAFTSPMALTWDLHFDRKGNGVLESGEQAVYPLTITISGGGNITATYGEGGLPGSYSGEIRSARANAVVRMLFTGPDLFAAFAGRQNGDGSLEGGWLDGARQTGDFRIVRTGASVSRAPDETTRLLPAGFRVSGSADLSGEWTLSFDRTYDGVLTSAPSGTNTLRVTATGSNGFAAVYSDGNSGSFAGSVHTARDNSVITALFTSFDYYGAWAGGIVNANTIVGVHYDVDGQSGDFVMTRLLPDLKPVDILGPTSGTASAAVPVGVAVANIGGATVTSDWGGEIRLTADQSCESSAIDPDALVYTDTTDLQPGDTAAAIRTAIIPSTITPGTYFWCVIVDWDPPGGIVAESDEGNNRLVGNQISITAADVARYELDGNGLDVSGNARHGVVYGASPTNDRFGVAGRALRFSGGSDRVEVPSDSGLSDATMNELTLVAWVRTTTDFQRLVSKALAFEYNYSLFVYNGHATVTAWQFAGADHLLAEGTTNVADGTWHLLVGTIVNGTVARVYVDGVLQATDNTPEGTWYRGGSGPLFLGVHPDYTAPAFAVQGLVGDLDGVRIIRRALSDAEIAALYVP